MREVEFQDSTSAIPPMELVCPLLEISFVTKYHSISNFKMECGVLIP